MNPLATRFERFLSSPERLGEQDPAVLEAKLGTILDRATRGWPEIALFDAENFVAYLAQKVPDDSDVNEYLATVQAEDLYLAWACWRGNPTAIQIVETRHMARIPAMLGGQISDRGVIEEVVQILRERLLIGTRDAQPAICTFTGQGTLGAWIRVSALRAAYRLLDDSKKQETSEAKTERAFVSAAADPELRYMQQHYRQAFQAAVTEAIEGLSGRLLSVLRYQALEGLSLAEIGTIYGVHESTVSRWAARAKSEVLGGVRERLMKELGVGQDELESIVAVLRSQIFDLSIRRALKRPAADGE